MRFPILLLSSLSTTISISSAWPDNSPLLSLLSGDTGTTTNDVNIDQTCRRLRTLTKLNDIANNQTVPDTTDMRGKLDQQRIDWIKSHSADITAKLNALASNSTLVAECDTINAQRDTARECKALATLETLVNSTSSQMSLDQGPASVLLTEDQKQKLQQKFEKAKLKLQELRSNATLMDLCTKDATLQQDGVIGSQVVDNSGAISMTKSAASSQMHELGKVASLMTLVVPILVLML